MDRTNVIKFRRDAGPLIVPTIVMIDLQREYVATPRLMVLPDVERALANCRMLLAYARGMGFPVAFTRQVRRTPFYNAGTRISQWIEGFSPLPTEMVFEREMPSCYDSEEFGRVMDDGIGSELVIAGFAGESACLSTIIDAHHRGHGVTFLADASASHALAAASSDVHALLSKVLSLYGTVTTTAKWIDATRQWFFLRDDECLPPSRVGDEARKR